MRDSDASLTTAMSRPAVTYPVVVVDHDPRLRTRLAMVLGESAKTASYPSIAAVEEKHPAGDALVVVFGPTFAEAAGLAEVEEFVRNRPEVGSVLVVDELSTHTLQQALRAGVRDVITNGETTQLFESVSRVAATLSSASARPGGVDASVPVSNGRLMLVFSTKGGAGKSMLASNLAVSLARRSAQPVVLVDGDLQFGDVAVMLKLTPQHTIVDAVAASHRLDAQLLQNLLIRHDASGLLVLPAPVEPAFADQVSAANMVQIIDTLRTMAGHVVVDTPAHFNDVVLSLLEEADDIILVAGMDIPNIKNVKLGLQTLRLLNIPMSKIKLVLNRANSKAKLDVGEVERTLQIKADCLVPSDVVVPQSVNKGVPAVLDAPKSAVARSLEQLASLFVDDVAAKRARR